MYDWEFASAHNVKIKTKDSSTEDMSFCKRVDCDRILLEGIVFARKNYCDRILMEGIRFRPFGPDIAEIR